MLNVFFLNLKVDMLWMTFGKVNGLRSIPIHDINRSLGSRPKALSFFLAFTCCDLVSAFVRKSKQTRPEMCLRTLKKYSYY